jgi:plastocyanin
VLSRVAGISPMPHQSQGRALVLLVAAFFASACASAAQAGTVRTASVNMPPSYRFDPIAIEVQAGEVVTWTNRDHFSHNVHVLGSAEWRSEVLAPGESVTYTFAAPGEYAYQCDLHPQDMTGKVIVASP